MSESTPTSNRSPIELLLAVLGIPAGGVVQVWMDDHNAGLYRIPDDDHFAAVIGTGTLTRALMAPGRCREICQLQPSIGLLVLQEDRRANRRTDSGYPAGYGSYQVSPATEVIGDPWKDLSEFIARILEPAFTRGELIAVEPGGWHHDRSAPFVLIGATMIDGQTRLVIETQPPVTDSDIWPPSDDPEGPSIAAPLHDGTLRSCGAFAVDAVMRWGVEPWDVTVTYLDPEELPEFRD
ncbi:hypothetical protein [Gordonia sp. VNK21]|uniref:hypothetical protein n=1 Tax=Gordonia sp. VNK21 TaxID=3382483 RepID=UPI0038D5036C